MKRDDTAGRTTGWPMFSDEDRGGRIGVHIVGKNVHKLLGWIFRETSSSDIGIDGEIELRKPDKTSHGRLVSVQIKCGESFLRERTATGYIYRGSLKHLRYWTEYSTPVILILCDPDTEMCYWQDVDLQKVHFHDKGWSTEVPFANQLSASAAEALTSIASRLQKKDLVELLLRDWLGWSFEHHIRFASGLTIPRDYHWFSLLAAVRNDFIMIDYVIAGIDGFDEAEIREMLRWASYNHSQYGYRRFLLCFISEATHLLEKIPDPTPIPGVTVEYVPLLLTLRGEPRLSEVGKDRRLIAFYDAGESLDDGANTVERNIRHCVPLSNDSALP